MGKLCRAEAPVAAANPISSNTCETPLTTWQSPTLVAAPVMLTRALRR